MRDLERNRSDPFVPTDVSKSESPSVSVKFPFLPRNKQLGVCKGGRLGSLWGFCLSPPQVLLGELAPFVLSLVNDDPPQFKQLSGAL